MKIVFISILGCLLINNINCSGYGKILQQFGAVSRLAEQLHNYNKPRVETNVPTKACKMITWLLIRVVDDVSLHLFEKNQINTFKYCQGENLCESMEKYKNDYLKLVTDNVDVIYSSKESSISESGKCSDESTLVSRRSRFFWSILIFVSSILG